jgi:cell division inhibitor SepF
MGGALRKTMIYLGLAEDDERYDAYDVEEEFADSDLADNEPGRRDPYLTRFGGAGGTRPRPGS